MKSGFSFMGAWLLDVDSRGIGYFSFCALPKKLGSGTFYVCGFRPQLRRVSLPYRISFSACRSRTRSSRTLIRSLKRMIWASFA